MKIHLLLFVSLLSILTSCGPVSSDTSDLRIISLAPNITETVYALGLEDSLLGVSSFCDFPTAATSKEKVGGLYDSNVEKIYALKPSVVFYLPSQKSQAKRLESLGIETIMVKNNSLAEIDQTILTVGKVCDKPLKAKQLIETLQAALPKRVKATGLKGLVVVSRSVSEKQISTMYVAGKGSWYESILNHLGVENAYQGSLPYPQVGIEGLLTMSPDFVIEIVVGAEEKKYTPKVQTEAWHFLYKPQSKHHLFIISDLYAVRPGPRYPLLFNKFQNIIKQVLNERR